MSSRSSLIFSILFLTGFLFILPINIAGKNISEVPLKIDGMQVLINDFFPPSTEDFKSTEFLAPQRYKVFDELSFEIDPKKISRPVEWFRKAKYRLDFGDGTTADKLSVAHTFLKAGSYVVVLYNEADPKNQEPVTSVLVNIFPMKNYQLPQPVIKINGQPAGSDNKLFVKYDQPLELDGSFSEAKSAPIVEYLWDLGDGAVSRDKKLTHKYNPLNYNARIILRTKDANGFYNDTLLEVINGGTVQKMPSAKPEATQFMENWVKKPIIREAGIILLVVLGIAGSILFYKKAIKKSK